MLIYDIIRKLLESFTETDIELLVLLLKGNLGQEEDSVCYIHCIIVFVSECGMEIRKDDPSSLKVNNCLDNAKTPSINQGCMQKFRLGGGGGANHAQVFFSSYISL